MKLKVTFDGNSEELEARRKRENKQLTEARGSWKHGEKGKMNG